MRWANLAVLALSNCQRCLCLAGTNISESVNFALQSIAIEKAPPAAVRAAPLPGQTVLPDGGIAALIRPGETHEYSLEHSLNSSSYLSLSECNRQPLTNDPLWLYSGIFQGSTQDGGLLEVQNFTGFNRTIKVFAPNSTDLTAAWSYQLGIDKSGSYAQYLPGLFWVDSDYANSLFVTELYKNFSGLVDDTPYAHVVNQSNLNSTTQKFSLFLHPARHHESDAPTVGAALHRSFCALQESALLNQNNADFSTTDRSNNISERLYRGQFLMKGLNRSTNYDLHLAIAPSTPGYTGGMLFGPVPFVTKNSASCQLIYNMSMCPQTAFSVPGNASEFTPYELAALYDHAVRDLYTNFTKALDQVNCNDTHENQFSVFYGCDQCAAAYRDWLCTVAVPRCADWSNDAPYLVERLPGQSRNRIINEVLRPGKYKEILPCYWLCDLISTYCPTAFGFQCPTGKMLNESYGWPSDNGDVSCSYPGAVYKPDGAWVLKPQWLILLGVSLCLFL